MAGNLGIGITIGATLGPSVASAFASVQDKIRATQKSFRQAASQSARLSDALAARQKRDAVAVKIQDGGSSPQLLADLKKLSLEYARVAKSAGVYGQSVAEITRRQREMARAAETGRARLAALQTAQNARATRRDESQTRRNAVGDAVATAASALAMAAPLKTGLEFEEAMSRVRAISGAVGADFEALRAQARELGATTVWSAKEAAQGMQFLSMAGFKTKDILGAMPGMLSLASAGAMDLASTADIASNVLSGFGFSADKMNYVADVMAKTFTNSNTSIQSIGESMKFCAPVAANAGQSFQDLAAMIGKLGDAGIQGTMAGTGLNAIISRLAAPPKAAASAIAELGIKVADANGKMRPMPEVLREISLKTKDMGEQQKIAYAKALFGQEHFAKGLVLMATAADGSLQKLSASLNEQGYANKVAGEQTNNLAGDLKALSSASQEVSICLFDTISPALRQIVGGITPIVQATGQWISQNPRLTQGLVLLGGALVALKTAALAFTLINSYRKTFAAGMAGLGAQATASLGTVRAGFSSLAAELNRPVSLSGMTSGVSSGASRISASFARIRQSVSQTVAHLRQIGPAGMAAGAAAAASGTAAAAGRVGWNTLRLGLRGVGMAFKTMFGPMSLVMMGLTYGVEQIIENWDKIQPYFQALWDGVKAIFNSVMSWLQPIIDKIMGFVSPFIDKISGIGELVGKAWDFVFGNDKAKEQKEKEKAEAEQRKQALNLSPELQKAVEAEKKADVSQAALPDASEAAVKTPAKMKEEQKKQEAAPASQKPKYRKNSPMPEFEEESSEEEENAAAAAYEPVLKKQAAKKRASAQAAPASAQPAAQAAPGQTQVMQPQVQVALNITQNGIPDAQFAQGVMNAIKSRQSELEAMISAIVNDQARLAYG